MLKYPFLTQQGTCQDGMLDTLSLDEPQLKCPFSSYVYCLY